MARRTRRKSRKSKSSRRRRRRQSGGSGVAQHAGEVTEPVPQTGGEADIEEGMGHKGGEVQKGGKRKRKSMKGGKKKKKKKTRKRKLNPFFKLMLAAKKTGAPSFKYKGKTYKGKKHHRLGMIYKKA
tara:strand:- start:444 stop:824 length:381 start_codon:yes stop_codon:yes gene_type:complete